MFNLNIISQMSEEVARKYMEKMRWGKELICPRCGNKKVWQIQGKSVRDGLYKCSDCRKPFTVKVGTIMEDSHLTMKQWLMTFYLMCSSKKGISSLQLQRQLGLGSYRTALFLTHRIRMAMNTNIFQKKLKGIVEVDETYIGGKPRKDSEHTEKLKRGRGTKKIPVMALVERKGKVISSPVENVSAKTLKTAIKECVDKDSKIMTDEWKSYIGIEKDFAGGHGVVNHRTGEYVNGDILTNSAESYFALLKRGIHGVFHHISKQHFPRYCDEFSFRWNYRKINDNIRTEEAIKGMIGKRLMYKDLI